ncbi:MAG TPA: sulfatase [Actinomycetota bacterium]|nr:sulfatase [Actinomycetota bacterium]
MPERPGELPNIVLVVFDTARWDRFGCYGYERPTTPTVDALAAEGLRAETMIANGPWTLPAHGSLFTGLYPSQHGSQWQTGPTLRESAMPTLAEWLRSIGYDTWCVTNNGLVSERTGLARGFDHYAFRLDIERGWRRAARRIPKALFGGDSGGSIVNRWMRKHLPEARKPLFLFVNYLECHWAYAPPRKLARRMQGPRYGPFAGLRYRLRTAARVGPWEAIAGADGRDLDVLSTYYDGELANADRHLAGLLEILRGTGHVADDGRALVMVTSDHGEHLGEHRASGEPGGRHGLADHHASLDDHLIRVPFVAWGPGLVPKGTRGGMYELVDVFPSIARFLGRQSPGEHLDERRRDLLSPTRDSFGEEYAFAEWRAWTDKERDRLAKRNPSYDFGGLARDLLAARDRRFKLVRSADGSEALYDTANDPLEQEDLTSVRVETAKRLREQLDMAVASWGRWDRPPEPTTPEEQAEIEQRLAELGYI